MQPPAPDWPPLFLSLAIELTLVVTMALVIQLALKTALWRRLLWQVALLSMAVVTLVEVSGIRRSVRLWAVEHVPEPPAARPALAPIPLRGSAPPTVHYVETVATPLAVELDRVAFVETVPWWPGMLWLGGFTLLMLRGTIARLLFSCFQRGRQSWVVDPALLQRVQALARHVGLHRAVRVSYTTGLTGPIAFGILRPCISLPVDFCEKFSRTQQEAMLAHELAHLAANDPAWQWLTDLVAALLWWHPLAWWARRQFRRSCEAAADEASLLVENGPHALAECLVVLGTRLARSPALGGLGVEGDHYRSGLGQRVKCLLHLHGQPWRPRRRRLTCLLTSCCPVMLALAVLAGTSWAQPREAKSETFGESFRQSMVGLAWSSILQVNLSNKASGVTEPGTPEPERIDWQPWSQAALAEARAAGKPVLVHFTADWCVTAQVNEKSSLELPAVREKLRAIGAVALRADCTKPTEATAAELRTHGRADVPLTLAYSPDPNEPPQVLPALLTPELVLQALDRTVQSPAAVPSKPAETTKNEAPSLILQGKALLDAGKLAEAESKLKEALKLDPANKAAAHYLATLAETRREKVTAPKYVTVPLLSELPVVGALFATNAPDKEGAAAGPAGISSPQGPPTSDLHTRWFKVDPNTLATNLRELLGTNAVQSKTASFTESAVMNLRRLLDASGVDLSPQKSILFNNRSGILMVRATLSELDAIEQVIQMLNTSPPQVTIEVRFCEITEEDGKKLGFDWFLGNSSAAPRSNSTSQSSPASLPNLGTPDNGVTPGLRDVASEFAGATVTGILTEPQFGVVLRALEQRRGVNLMTSPKVTTLSGRQAQIKTVEVRYIVTDVDFNTNATPPFVGNSDSIGIQPIAQPFELGPVIDVVPYVSADGYTISLTVIATIKEFIGYDNKEGFMATLRTAKSEPQSSPTPLPAFRLRQVVTSAVVWDGQTLVLSGGSMAFEDAAERTKIAGQKGASRLLRSNAARGQRKSLLVFVTPTIIDPAGNRVHSPDELPIRKTSVPPQKGSGVR